MMQVIFVITESKILHFLIDNSFSSKIGENPNVLTFCKEIFKTSICVFKFRKFRFIGTKLKDRNFTLWSSSFPIAFVLLAEHFLSAPFTLPRGLLLDALRHALLVS